MFFGHKAKNIVSGVWETNVYPHLERNYRHYRCYYKVLYEYSSFRFMINLLKDKDDIMLFIYPASENSKYDRKVSDKLDISRLTTLYLTDLTKYDNIVIELIANKKILYSDNLTGTEFEQIKKERGRY